MPRLQHSDSSDLRVVILKVKLSFDAMICLSCIPSLRKILSVNKFVCPKLAASDFDL